MIALLWFSAAGLQSFLSGIDGWLERTVMGDPAYIHIADGISLRQLRLFDAIGTFNSVRRASEHCSLSQPAVTQSLSKLERHIGSILVERTASGSFLNTEGKIFHRRTSRFFAMVVEALQHAGAAQSSAEANIVLNRLTRAQMRSLIAMCDHGGIQQAADALKITVASLQRAGRDLEANLGIALVYRTAMGLIVNPVGHEIGRALKLALQEIELGLDEIAASKGIGLRQVVVGGMPYGGSVLIAGVLKQFIDSNPDAAIRIMSESASEVINSLRSGDVDLVVGLLPDNADEDLNFEPLARTPYAVAVRRGHPLLRAGSVNMDMLRNGDWIAGTKGSSRRAQFDRLFAGSPPRSRVTTGSPPIIRAMLEQSDRMTLMTTYELENEPTMRAIKIGEQLDCPSIGIITRKNWEPTAAHRSFCNLLRCHVSSLDSFEMISKASGNQDT
jgi:DNA-binding transcriptional LysR family regulator